MHASRPPRTPLVAPGQIDHHVGDMTATFSADVTLGQALSLLAANDQWLPIDGESDQSLGRLAAVNSTGPLRVAYGAWRDMLLGCQFRDRQGRLMTVGGRTVKNVAGYDVTKLMVGQAGTLGEMVTLTTRTYKLPEARLVAEFNSDGTLVGRLLPADICPNWVLRTPTGITAGWLGEAAWIAFAEGRLPSFNPRSVRRVSADEESTIRRGHWITQVRQADQALVRASVPPADLEGLLTSGAFGQHYAADPVFGICLAELPPDAVGTLRTRCQSLGGGVRIIDGVGAGLVTPSDANRQQLIERLVAAFGGSHS